MADIFSREGIIERSNGLGEAGGTPIIDGLRDRACLNLKRQGCHDTSPTNYYCLSA